MKKYRSWRYLISLLLVILVLQGCGTGEESIVEESSQKQESSEVQESKEESSEELVEEKQDVLRDLAKIEKRIRMYRQYQAVLAEEADMLQRGRVFAMLVDFNEDTYPELILSHGNAEGQRTDEVYTVSTREKAEQIYLEYSMDLSEEVHGLRLYMLDGKTYITHNEMDGKQVWWNMKDVGVLYGGTEEKYPFTTAENVEALDTIMNRRYCISADEMSEKVYDLSLEEVTEFYEQYVDGLEWREGKASAALWDLIVYLDEGEIYKVDTENGWISTGEYVAELKNTQFFDGAKQALEDKIKAEAAITGPSIFKNIKSEDDIRQNVRMYEAYRSLIMELQEQEAQIRFAQLVNFEGDFWPELVLSIQSAGAYTDYIYYYGADGLQCIYQEASGELQAGTGIGFKKTEDRVYLIKVEGFGAELLTLNAGQMQVSEKIPAEGTEEICIFAEEATEEDVAAIQQVLYERNIIYWLENGQVRAACAMSPEEVYILHNKCAARWETWEQDKGESERLQEEFCIYLGSGEMIYYDRAMRQVRSEGYIRELDNLLIGNRDLMYRFYSKMLMPGWIPEEAEDDDMVDNPDYLVQIYEDYMTENPINPPHESYSGAAWLMPEDAYDFVKVEIVFEDFYYTITDADILARMAEVIAAAQPRASFGCPLGICLGITRADGEVFYLHPAEDGCSVFASNGYYFEYEAGEARNLWEIMEYPEYEVIDDIQEMKE